MYKVHVQEIAQQWYVCCAIIGYRHSLVPRPLPHFQCCNIENMGVACGQGYDRHYDNVDKDWSFIEYMPYASAPSIDHVM